MSASLVGSEMCIRDSLQALQEPADLVGVPAVAAADLLEVQPLDAGANACLLYTSDAADDM
eukprot:13099151-Alexandrium_andersonii.AAC.1